ncbi:5-oxoprolinase subunit PxpA [Opitutus sp. ER46]|uniref:LamB/YcsF family protein n=1 Tax=Opitutus sp. ER46 TaxID=2161864 RepID=UPI001E36FBAC|nr:5-oxoprolinase subunit PxpA [Opitutus sp. ER46]
MQRFIDLNCDLGEGAGQDEALMPLISSANIACGAHAGDLATMIETTELALHHRVGIGAHPGYFDLHDFGRRERDITPAEAGRLVLIQVEQLHEIAGTKLRHVKLHGALYNQVCRDAYLAEGVVADLARLWPNLIVYALAGSELAQLARARGLRVAHEVFADRTYQRDGTLTPRARPDALIHDEAAAVAQVLRLLREGVVRATDGTDVPLRADTICLHGDGPHAVAFARRLNRELEAAGVVIRPCTG